MEQKKIKLLNEAQEILPMVAPRQCPLEGTYAEVSLLAMLLVDKCQYHLPLYRQYQRLIDSGIKVSRSTLTSYFHRTADLLKPIEEALLSSIRAGGVTSIDETTLKVGLSANKNKRQMHKGYLWVIYGMNHEIVFRYSATRNGSNANELLGEDYKGVLLTDGFSGYQSYDDRMTTIAHAICWAHVRRKFFEALESESALNAKKAIEFIRLAYEVERKLKASNATPEEVLTVRGERTRRIIDEFFVWLKECFVAESLLPTNLFTKAASYALKREKGLRVFLDNHAVPIDNNHEEREIRNVAMGRKNFMFCWTEIGAEYLSIVYSLMCSCKLQDVNPYDYLV